MSKKKIKDEAYYLSLDRRTKEYREWKANYEASKGVGDVIEDFTKLTGIQALTKRLFGKDCGCEERQQKINEYFGKPVNPLTEEDYIFLHSVINGSSKIKPREQLRMKDIFEKTFNKRLSSTCLSCSFISEIYNPLKRLFDKYQ
jgi:hypothetical protein